MDRVSDERLDELIAWAAHRKAMSEIFGGGINSDALSALTELRDRRQASEAPFPEHAKMVAAWGLS